MKTNNWDERHTKILNDLFEKLNNEKIRFFVLRNYEGLPEINNAKDIDIVVDPMRHKDAKEILKNTYKENNIIHYYEATFAYLHCCHGINVHEQFSIHIDIIGSYVSKGSELFTFDELYSFTETYKNIRVLNKYFDGVMVFIYKQFNYKPILKDSYKELIYDTHKNYPEFQKLIIKLIGNDLGKNIFDAIEKKDFDKMISYSSSLTKELKKYAFRKNPIKTVKYTLNFYLEKLNRILFSYNKFAKTFSVMAPDGAGKTTFLENLIKEIDFFFINEKNERYSIYHFRPNILPNLGELGEKAGIKEQDKDFTNPHRSKPANKLSSLIRISYYWLDYVLGYSYFVRKDVQYDRFSIFDRYSYDLIVDPLRTKLNLPLWIRKFYVSLMQHPKIVFYLDAEPETIFKRKQELTQDEITRQTKEYKKVVKSNKRFISLNANRNVDEIVNEAIEIILNKYTTKI